MAPTHDDSREQLELYTLGRADVQAARAPALPAAHRLLHQPKAFALLAYLASSGVPVRRDLVAALFWPDRDETHARNSLSRTLGRVADALGAKVVEPCGAWEIAIRPAMVWCDAREFERAASAGDHARALELFRGEFLDGWHLPGLSEFSHWLESHRLRLRQLAVQSARRLARDCVALGDLDRAVATLRRAHTLGPANEVVTRELMTTLSRQGDSAGALEVFADATAWLRREVGAGPATQTRALAEAIRAGGEEASPEAQRSIPTSVAPDAAPLSVHPSVREAYLKGRFFSAMLPDVPKSIAFFREALSHDQEYAPAWAGLAMAYANLALFVYLPPADALPEVARAAAEALRRDPQSGEAHMARGLSHLLGDWDWAAAGRDLRRAVDLAPAAVEPRVYHAMFQSAMGRHDLALSEAMRAAMLDPLGPGTRFALALCRYKAGDHDASVSELDSALELYPQFLLALPLLAANHALAGRPNAAIAAARRALAALPGDQHVLAYAAASLGLAGERAEAHRAFETLLQFDRDRYVDPWAIAVACCGLGDLEQALVWLRRLRERRSPSAFCVKTEPMFAGLHAHPEYQLIVARLCFP
jgi:DNA-binding SARP family transcriptional activator/Tfp pilus assembly protein PilF